MACNCNTPAVCSTRRGYTYITNNLAQSVPTNGLVNPGTVVRTSCIGNITIQGNNSFVVNSSGTYYIDAIMYGTPTAVGSATTGTIQPTISVNGLVISSPVMSVTTTNFDTSYQVRAVMNLCSGDVITISNLGTFTLTLAGSNTQGSQNVNILIEKYK